MANPFTITSVSNYNANPPSDDGAQTAANRVQWSTQKTKLADPIKTAFDASEAETSTAFGKMLGGGGITTTAISYGVSASDQGKLVKATAAGITITTPDATVVGSPFVFGFLNASSGDVTFDGSGSQTVDGDLSFTVPAGCGLLLNTDGSNWFTFGRDFNNVLDPPQGYLTLTSGTPIINSDVTAATSVFYTLDKGDRAPITTDGASFKLRQFSELTLSLVSNHLASTIYDVFLFDNSGVITIGTGPAWNNSGSGTGARGTGAGTTELQRVHGLFTNKNSMTARNGSTTYSVAANQGLYIGSIFIDGSAGQVSCHVSYGQSRKWGLWNAFNRKRIYIKAGDSTPTWNYNTSTVRPANNASANSITTFTGLAEELISLEESQFITLMNASSLTNAAGTAKIGVGINSTTVFSGTIGSGSAQYGQAAAFSAIFSSQILAKATILPGLGINTVTALESTPTATGINVAYTGSESSMLMSASYFG